MKTDPVHKPTVAERGRKELMGLFIPFEAAEHCFSADWEKICVHVYLQKISMIWKTHYQPVELNWHL